MTCNEVQGALSLYLYGELDFGREEAVEQHLAACAFCTMALGREKSWHASLHAETQDASLDLLSRCRRDLTARLVAEKAFNPARITFWQRLSDKFDVSGFRWSSRLAYASFLVLLGFGAGEAMRTARISDLLGNPLSSPVNMAGLLSGNTRVRDVQPGENGQVRILVENVRQGEMVVSPDDPRVRELLVAATRDPENPAVRVECVQLLMSQEGSDIRDALISSVLHDPNAAVRIKAVEGLRRFSDDMAARAALEVALQHDKEPTVRAEAIDVLAPGGGNRIEFTPDLIKTLRNLAESGQDDEYVKQRSRQLLEGAQSNSQLDTY